MSKKLDAKIRQISQEFSKIYNPQAAFGNKKLIELGKEAREVFRNKDKMLLCNDCNEYGEIECPECGGAGTIECQHDGVEDDEL